MKLLYTFLERYHFRGLAGYFLTWCAFFSLLFSTASASPNGRAIGHNNSHGHNAFGLEGNVVNPAGIIIGTGTAAVTNPGGHTLKGSLPKGNGSGSMTNHEGGFKIGTFANTGTNSNPKGHNTMVTGDTVFFSWPNSDVIVRIDPFGANKSVPRELKNKSTSHRGLVLAAGDVFCNAIPNLVHLSAPVASGNQKDNPAGGVDFNPGGGPDKLGEAGIGEKGWGTGNKGKGVGNIWVGNQGRGVGGGMAGGCKTAPPEPPDPPDPPEPPDLPDPPDPPKGIATVPLDKQVIPELAGCPALLEAANLELGITKEVIQVSIGAGLAANSNIQPCETLSQLVDVAGILRDVSGIRQAAMNEVFNELAPVDAPFTVVTAATIVTALAGHVGDGTKYDTVIEYIDAFVEYIRILDTEMSSPVGDSTAFVMEKYGVGIAENENSNIAAFVALRLASLETFGN